MLTHSSLWGKLKLWFGKKKGGERRGMQIKTHTELLGFSNWLDLEYYEENRSLKNSSNILGQDKKKFIFTTLSFSIQEYDAFIHFLYRGLLILYGVYSWAYHNFDNIVNSVYFKIVCYWYKKLQLTFYIWLSVDLIICPHIWIFLVVQSYLCEKWDFLFPLQSLCLISFLCLFFFSR